MSGFVWGMYKGLSVVVVVVVGAGWSRKKRTWKGRGRKVFLLRRVSKRLSICNRYGRDGERGRARRVRKDIAKFLYISSYHIYYSRLPHPTKPNIPLNSTNAPNSHSSYYNIINSRVSLSSSKQLPLPPLMHNTTSPLPPMHLPLRLGHPHEKLLVPDGNPAREYLHGILKVRV